VNTQSSTMPEARRIAPAVMSATRPFYWSLRRELWESRFIYIAPMAVAAVFLLGFGISLAHLPSRMHALDPAQQRSVLTAPYDFSATLLMVTGMLVGAFYCLDALYGERRDRSILFWKSLPVSDATSVLAKASIPLLILQPLIFVVTVALQLSMLLLASAVLLGSGSGAGMLWAQLSPIRMWLLLLYHLLMVHALMHAPFYGWLLLVSGWPRRAAFLWAALPPVGIIALERIAFHSTHFVNLLGDQLSGSGLDAIVAPDTLPMNPMTHVTPGLLLGSANLWMGLLLTAAFLFAAVRLRRYRGPL